MKYLPLKAIWHILRAAEDIAECAGSAETEDIAIESLIREVKDFVEHRLEPKPTAKDKK